MTDIKDIARSHVGRRHKISRVEMTAILDDLAARGLVSLDNGWGGPDAAGWAKMCDGIQVISVLADDDAPAARAASSNPGSIRYDDPGSMHPLMHATLMFAPDELADHPYDQIGQLRNKADRVLIVSADDDAPAIATAPATRCECDNGHVWRTDDPQRDWQCPTCGEPWV